VVHDAPVRVQHIGRRVDGGQQPDGQKAERQQAWQHPTLECRKLFLRLSQRQDHEGHETGDCRDQGPYEKRSRKVGQRLAGIQSPEHARGRAEAQLDENGSCTQPPSHSRTRGRMGLRPAPKKERRSGVQKKRGGNPEDVARLLEGLGSKPAHARQKDPRDLREVRRPHDLRQDDAEQHPLDQRQG
jgi:hypothetical protein